MYVDFSLKDKKTNFPPWLNISLLRFFALKLYFKTLNHVLNVSDVQRRKFEVRRSSGCLDIQRNSLLRALLVYKNQYLCSFWGQNMEKSYSNHHRNLVQMKVDKDFKKVLNTFLKIFEKLASLSPGTTLS